MIWEKKEKGQGLVEFALILPFLLILMIGIVEGGIALNRQLTVVNAAREGARFGAYGTTANEIYAQTLRATSQMFEFTEENAVVAVILAKTNEDGFEEWVETTYPADATAPHVTPDSVLERLGDDAANLSLVIVDVRYDHESLLGLPFVGALADQIPIGSWTVMRVHSMHRKSRCCALPITFPIEDLGGLSIGDELDDIRIGNGLGQFGWLFWLPGEPGAGSAAILRRNLLDRCQAQNFQDACDGTPELTSGSWVWGDSGETMGVHDEIETLVGGYYAVPVWDEFEACNVLGGRCAYCWPGTKVAHIVGFALMEITEVKLTGSPKTISAKFRGWYDGCD